MGDRHQLDDCSRFCPGICVVDNLTTDNLTAFLENTIKIHGKPREILTDNGAENGQTSPESKFEFNGVTGWVLSIYDQKCINLLPQAKLKDSIKQSRKNCPTATTILRCSDTGIITSDHTQACI